MKYHPAVNNILKNPNEIAANTNELKEVISEKNKESKLSTNGENLTIKIIVNTGSLRKEIDIKLFVIIDHARIKYIKSFLEYKLFLDAITNENKADGIKRSSNLITSIKDIIAKNDTYKNVFKDIEFDITNDKIDNEIIASGEKTLNVNFSFTENNKLINSSLKLNVNLQGKSRKEVNQYLADKLRKDYFVSGKDMESFFAQTVFANKSTYKDLIDELILFAPDNLFYLRLMDWIDFDNTDSNVSNEFTIEGITNEQLNKQIVSSSGKGWELINLKLHYFVGKGEDKVKVSWTNKFSVKIMEENYEHKDLFLYITKIREALWQHLLKYKVKTKIGNTYGELNTELQNEIDRFRQNIINLKNRDDVKIRIRTTYGGHNEKIFISKENLLRGRFYSIQVEFMVDKTKFPDLWASTLLNYISVN